jgi:hypothetical protein
MPTAPRVDPSTWPLYPPESWFDLPAEVPDDVYCNVVLDGPEAGRVYGLVHHAGTNLLGAPGGPWTPPPSPNGLHDSQLGVTETAEGTTVRTANVGGRVNHAPLTSGYHEAVKHYENIASQTMRVRYHQIQTKSGPAIAYSGAMWPDLTELDVARVRASALSGDWRWRPEYNGYDFCGSQLVTNPGLPLRMVAAVGEHPPIVVCDDGSCSMPVDPTQARLDEVEDAIAEFADLLGYEVEPAPFTAAICAPADRLDDIECALEELVVTAATWTKGEGGLFTGSESDGPAYEGNRYVTLSDGTHVDQLTGEERLKATGPALAFPTTDDELRASVQDPKNPSRTLDGTEITADTQLTVFHSYDNLGDEKDALLRYGAEPDAKPMTLARSNYESGEAATYAPGAGVGGGLYVSGDPNSASGYGHNMVAIQVRAGDIVTPPESNVPGGDPLAALKDGNGAMIAVPIPPSNIRAFGADRRMTPQLSIDELQPPRTAAGKTWALDFRQHANDPGGGVPRWTKGEHGLFTGSEATGGRAHESAGGMVPKPPGTPAGKGAVWIKGGKVRVGDRVSVDPEFVVPAATVTETKGMIGVRFDSGAEREFDPHHLTKGDGGDEFHKGEVVSLPDAKDLLEVFGKKIPGVDAVRGPHEPIHKVPFKAGADWDPDLHPRDELGQFAESEGDAGGDPLPPTEDRVAELQARLESETDPVALAATDLMLRAATADEVVTPRLEAIAKDLNVDLYGLKFRLKGEGRLSEKIEEKIKEGLTAEEAAGRIKDSLRYTIGVEDHTEYTAKAQAALDRLRDEGFRVLEEKNYWHRPEGESHDAYNGLNTVLRHDETGQLIELQFHTPDSFRVKEEETHALYEEYRRSSTSVERRQELYDTMAAMWDDVPEPTDASAIGTPVYEPRPVAA